jgi:cell wall-associated NlpC family hydrolase
VIRKLGCLGVLAALGIGLVALTAALAPSEGMSLGGDGGMVAREAGIPPVMRQAYAQAASGVQAYSPGCRGMHWSILAGVARVESDHAASREIADDGTIDPPVLGPRLDGSGVGGNTTPITDTDGGAWDGDTQYDRAVGPFQFIPSTFAAWGVSARGEGEADPHNAFDATLSAARYLCGDGRDLRQADDLREALYAYNHSSAYVDEVLDWIERYRAPRAEPAGDRARTVVDAATDQLGVRYSWGGGDATGPTQGSCCSPSGRSGERITGFDCSGLTLYAYAQVGIELPHNAAAQATLGERLSRAELQPGDLVFYAFGDAASTVHHVGIYVGSGYMINAPRPDTKVRYDSISSMPGFWGGGRLL